MGSTATPLLPSSHAHHGSGFNTMTAAVIGSGMAGILAAIELKKAGFDVIVFEKASTLGGTWRDNTYPGLSCDVPAHSYTFSFARNPDWSMQYAPGPEIREYFQHVADQFGVTECIRFNSEVTSLEWTNTHWQLSTSDGYRGDFPYVFAATGVLHHPNIPDMPGIEDFEGAVFHSARWDHSIPLEGKNVAVIGTGSTAIQITSALVDQVDEFALFQRSAQWVLPAPNPEFSEEQRSAFRDDPAAHEEFVRELAITMFQRTSSAVTEPDSVEYQKVAALCQRNLDTVVDDELRKQLTPDHQPMCKRLIASSDFYEKIQRPNARLVTSSIDTFTPTGIRTADGIEHEFDVVVLATGFRSDRFIRPTRVIGIDDTDLDDVWSPSPIAYLSVMVPGFPNLFLLNGPNGPIGNFSLIEIAERQMSYCMQLISEVECSASQAVVPTSEATKAFESERRDAAKHTIWMSGCNSWYLDATGVPASWTFSYDRFVEEMSAPKLDAFTMS
jgi:cation diffusion facilitator CzcD-associated flavoprotein CzcO